MSCFKLRFTKYLLLLESAPKNYTPGWIETSYEFNYLITVKIYVEKVGFISVDTKISEFVSERPFYFNIKI